MTRKEKSQRHIKLTLNIYHSVLFKIRVHQQERAEHKLRTPNYRIQFPYSAARSCSHQDPVGFRRITVFILESNLRGFLFYYQQFFRDIIFKFILFYLQYILLSLFWLIQLMIFLIIVCLDAHKNLLEFILLTFTVIPKSRK